MRTKMLYVLLAAVWLPALGQDSGQDSGPEAAPVMPGDTVAESEPGPEAVAAPGVVDHFARDTYRVIQDTPRRW